MNNTLNRVGVIFCFVIAFGLLAGCVNTKSYSTNLAKNFLIKLDKNTDSNVKVRVDVNLLDIECSGPYQGSYWAGKESGNIGLKVNQRTLLTFIFESTTWLVGKHSNQMTALVKPRVGYRYVSHVSYIDDAFDVEIFEINRKTKIRKAIEIVGIQACKVGKPN